MVLIPALVLLALLPSLAAAHGVAPSGPADVWRHWALRPEILVGLALTGWLYLRGLSRLWARAGVGRGISTRRAAAFGAGLLVLAVALLSPLDPLGEVLFSAHMTQHLLLILVAAPLLVVGAAETALLWALPLRWRGRMGRAWQGLLGLVGGGVRGEARLAVLSVAGATGVLWLWHVPALYDLAIRDDAMHAAEHVSFLATSVLFWASVLRLRPRDDLENGLRVLYVFAMAVQGSVLGALITLAQRPIYDSHARIATEWGLTPLADQQLAGLIMWVPPALLYVSVAGWLFVRWLDAVGRRRTAADRRDGRTPPSPATRHEATPLRR